MRKLIIATFVILGIAGALVLFAAPVVLPAIVPASSTATSTPPHGTP